MRSENDQQRNDQREHYQQFLVQLIIRRLGK